MRVDKCGCPRGEEEIWDAYVQTYRGNGKPYRGIFECPKISRWHCMVFEWAFLWCGYRVLVRQRQESLFFSTLTETGVCYLTEWDMSFPFTDFS